MTKINPYLIPKENLPKTEEVVYLDNNYQPQSYEDFMKTYESNEAVELINEAEWQDRLLHGPQYGPGNEQSKSVAKKIGSAALAVSYFTPLGAVTGPLTVAGVVGGYAVEKAAEANGDDDAKEVANFIKGLSIGAAIDGLSGGTLNAGALTAAKVTKKVCQVYSGANDIVDMVNGEYIPGMATSKEIGTVANHVIKYGL